MVFFGTHDVISRVLTFFLIGYKLEPTEDLFIQTWVYKRYSQTLYLV